ncbi:MULTISPECIES: F0F1 ATP synthase subunit delta [Piscirickettsiaceae]|jgi:F-type H+-transporting ATPase subunit delta|uniref:ATP synthase subunit delta n=1 Tax=Hydrogenovibrio thermophilus TaxID=265883 RepID=A0A410H5Y0_9GAMM|nr:MULTISPECIES: F0F1 ATP synthase subunit delta [Piscirickettsiaceae]AZR80987.1 ATP synthase subunit delta [Thiomicrospira sp. S5]QAB16319.1 F0F1 ATP synthase subunit delta [Hydrogenovibrio thermophilus]
MAELITIARPYAEAAFDVAKEENKLAEWSEQLTSLAAIASDDAMQAFMVNPVATEEEVLDIFVGVMGTALTNEAKNLLTIMSENKRLAALSDVAELFEQLKAEDEKRVRATVVSARKATVEQKKKLSAALNAKFDADVEISYEEDPTLIAGIKIKVGDWVVDGSARSQLNKLGAAIAQ